MIAFTKLKEDLKAICQACESTGFATSEEAYRFANEKFLQWFKQRDALYQLMQGKKLTDDQESAKQEIETKLQEMRFGFETVIGADNSSVSIYVDLISNENNDAKTTNTKVVCDWADAELAGERYDLHIDLLA